MVVELGLAGPELAAELELDVGLFVLELADENSKSGIREPSLELR